jgi:hypothetical protein
VGECGRGKSIVASAWSLRMDEEKGLCPLDSITFPDVTLRLYRRGC